MKRQLIGLLLLSALLLTSCGSGEPSTGTTAQTDSSVTSSSTEETTAVPEEEQMLELIADGKAIYKLLRSEESTSAMVSNVTALHRNLKKYTSVEMAIVTDWTRKGAEADNSQPEILIGETNRRATQELLALPQRPTCIIFPDDYAYIGGRNVILDAGLRIPEDISVAGYDGIPLAELVRPKLTTVSQNAREIGVRTGQLMLKTIHAKGVFTPDHITVPSTFIMGASVAPVSPASA